MSVAWEFGAALLAVYGLVWAFSFVKKIVGGSL